MSAGILAILGVQVTRKKTLQSVAERFLASFLGLLAGYLFFSLLDFSAWVIGIIILLFFPLLVRLRLQEGIVTSCVMILHLYAVKDLSLSLFWNEISIITIGFGIALLVNVSYMPSLRKEIAAYTREVNELFSRIFYHFQQHLSEKDYVWDGKELIELEEKIAEAKNLALRTIENNLLRNEDEFYRFVRMREKQFDWVQRMMVLIARIERPVEPQSFLLASLFETLSQEVKSPYFSGKASWKLKQLRQTVDQMELPKSREEFEVRASLFHLLYELERYLAIAEREKPHRPQEQSNK
ncbi:aromatic acid exporter family protein [Bacillaceae bacterium]